MGSALAVSMHTARSPTPAPAVISIHVHLRGGRRRMPRSCQQLSILTHRRCCASSAFPRASSENQNHLRTYMVGADAPHICTRAPSPGDAACASERCAAPTNPRREPIAVSTHAGTPAGKVPSKCTYIDRRTRGARRRRTSSGPQRCAAAAARMCVTACDAEYLVCTYIDGSARPPSPSPGGLTPLRSMQNKAVSFHQH